MNNYDEEYDDLDEAEELEEQTKPKKKRFNIFDWYFNREAKNDKFEDINALEKPTIKNFLKLTWRRIGKLVSTNLIFIIANFPVLFLVIAMSGILSESAYAPLYQQWGVVKGASLFEQSAEISNYITLFGTKNSVNVINTPTIVFFALGLLLFFTMGFAKVGTTYIYRNIVLGEPIFPLSDFFYIIKRNIKQSLIFGFIDMLFISMFAYNIYFLYVNYSVSTLNSIMLFFTIAMACVYLVARQYAYLMIFTFKLPLTKIIKNSLYFVVLGIKRNLVAFLFTLLLVGLNVLIFLIYIPLGAILPFVVTISLIDFIGVYAAYPNIDKYMVDHSLDNANDEEPQEIVTESAE